MFQELVNLDFFHRNRSFLTANAPARLYESLSIILSYFAVVVNKVVTFLVTRSRGQLTCLYLKASRKLEEFRVFLLRERKTYVMIIYIKHIIDYDKIGSW